MNHPETVKYTIKRGDTLFQIAYTFQTTEEKILALNPGLDPMYLQVGRIICILPKTANMRQAIQPGKQSGIPAKQLAIHDRFRVLWEQHIMYTRMVINAVVDPAPDDAAVTARLLRNPKDFGQVYREFFGDQAEKEIERIITEHLTIGKQLFTAFGKGDTEKASGLKTAWYENADAWAAYLVYLSPHMDAAAMRSMLHTHLDLVLQQAETRMDKNYSENVVANDKGEAMALEMADIMSGALLRQFYPQFK